MTIPKGNFQTKILSLASIHKDGWRYAQIFPWGRSRRRCMYRNCSIPCGKGGVSSPTMYGAVTIYRCLHWTLRSLWTIRILCNTIYTALDARPVEPFWLYELCICNVPQFLL